MDISTNKDSSVLVAMIVTALLGITGVAWLLLNGDGRNVVTHEPTSLTHDDEQPVRFSADHTNAVDKAIQMAELAFQAGQVATPPENSAVHFYRQVLAMEPTNPRALTGMNLIATQLNDEALEYLEKHDYEKAVTTLNLLNDVAPDSDNVIAVRLSLVEKKQIMYAALDEAVARQQFKQAEELVRKLQVFPEADTARISAAKVQIATARNQAEIARNTMADAPLVTDPVVEYSSSSENSAHTETAAENVVATKEVAIETAADGPAVVMNSEFADAAETLAMAAPQIATAQDIPGVENTADFENNEPQQSEEAFISPDTVARLREQVQTLIATANDRVANDELLSPEQDSASHYYRQALLLDPGNAEAKRGLRALVQSVTTNALHKGEIGDWDAAEALLLQAGQVGYAENIIAQTRAALKQQRRAAEEEKLVSIDQFMVKKSVAPKYPRRAVSRSVEGWVTLEFVVDANGETRDIRVVETSKQYATQFSKAAISAIEQWRFKPRTFDGEAISQRSKTTVQFKLTD